MQHIVHQLEKNGNLNSSSRYHLPLRPLVIRSTLLFLIFCHAVVAESQRTNSNLQVILKRRPYVHLRDSSALSNPVKRAKTEHLWLAASYKHIFQFKATTTSFSMLSGFS